MQNKPQNLNKKQQNVTVLGISKPNAKQTTTRHLNKKQ